MGLRPFLVLRPVGFLSQKGPRKTGSNSVGDEESSVPLSLYAVALPQQPLSFQLQTRRTPGTAKEDPKKESRRTDFSAIGIKSQAKTKAKGKTREVGWLGAWAAGQQDSNYVVGLAGSFLPPPPSFALSLSVLLLREGRLGRKLESFVRKEPYTPSALFTQPARPFLPFYFDRLPALTTCPCYSALAHFIYFCVS